jgi:hypothetical protein
VAAAAVILIRQLPGSSGLDGDRYTALVELEVGMHCCHCGEEMPPGSRAVFLAETNKPVKFAHQRSACPRPPARRHRPVVND